MATGFGAGDPLTEVGAYSLGAYSLGAYNLGAYSLGAYSLGTYSRPTDFGSRQPNICSLEEITPWRQKDPKQRGLRGSLQAYRLGAYSLGAYSLRATNFGSRRPLIGLGAYSLGAYSLGAYSLGASRATDFGSRSANTRLERI